MRKLLNLILATILILGSFVLPTKADVAPAPLPPISQDIVPIPSWNVCVVIDCYGNGTCVIVGAMACVTIDKQ